MNKKELHDLLKELHNELQNTNIVNSKDRELLQTLMDDIKRIISEPRGEGINQYATLNQQLNTSIDNLEESYPTILLMIRRLAETLSNMGI